MIPWMKMMMSEWILCVHRAKCLYMERKEIKLQCKLETCRVDIQKSSMKKQQPNKT
jgi:hypothetical protein